jgi:acetyltransferase-like isoleucine patch superfamily enzyme
MNTLKTLLRLQPAIIKTIWVNFKFLPFESAIKLPIMVSSRTVISGNDKIHIHGKVRAGMVKIGFGEIGIFDKKLSRTIIQLGGQIHFQGAAFIGHGSRIVVESSGLLELGEQFTISTESTIICRKHIHIGNDVLFSWGIQVMDTDYHKIIKNGQQINVDEDITIGSHTWVCSHAMVFKETKIMPQTVIASGAILAGKYTEPHTILGGIPAKALKTDIDWER